MDEKAMHSRQQTFDQEDREIEDEILMFKRKGHGPRRVKPSQPQARKLLISKTKLRKQCVIRRKETAMKELGKISQEKEKDLRVLFSRQHFKYSFNPTLLPQLFFLFQSLLPPGQIIGQNRSHLHFHYPPQILPFSQLTSQPVPNLLVTGAIFFFFFTK